MVFVHVRPSPTLVLPDIGPPVCGVRSLVDLFVCLCDSDISDQFSLVSYE